MKRVGLAAVAAAALLLAACGGGSKPGPTDTTSGSLPGASSGATPATAFRALYAPLGGILPYPFDAYFAGSTDGTLRMPVSSFAPVSFRRPGSTTAEPVMNALDGFSTTQPFSQRFSSALSAASLTAANVIVLQVNTDLATKGVTGVVRPLVAGTDYSVGLEPTSGGSTLNITPLKPLAAKSSYLVLLTSGITSSAGTPASADADYAAIRDQIISEFAQRPANAPPAPAACTPFTNATIKALCQLTSTHFLIAKGGLNLDLSKIVLSASFTTQSISDTLALLNQQVMAGPPSAYTLQNTGLTTAALPGSPGLARIYSGTLRTTYYSGVPSAANPTAPLTYYWLSATGPAVPSFDQSSRLITQFNPLPAATATLDIPLLLTVPAAGAPGANGKWPVVIFQHGFPRSRGDALLVADSFAAAGFAVIAIDLPLNGITNNADETFGFLRQAGRERTFDLDLVNNATGAAGPDGKQDATGTHFLNLTNMLVTRDNGRQAEVDLMRLIRTIPAIDFNNDGTPDLDGGRINLVAYSAGTIVGTTVLGLNDQVKAAALPAPVAGLMSTLRNSAFYGPQINAALAPNGLTPGTTLYENFWRDAQTAVDSADSVNYAARAVQLPAGAARKIYVGYFKGGAPNPAGGTWASDTTVPNSSSLLLASLMGLTPRTTSGPVTGTGVQVAFNQGIHNSYLDPRPAPTATAELQKQIATFIATGGAQLVVTDPTVVAAP